MFIIFGTRNREKTVASGEFYCPHCNTSRDYNTKAVAQYFALFFIPIIKLKEYGRFVECQHCHNKYKESILNYKAPSPIEQVADIVRRDLDSGTPIEMARQKLANQGVDKQLAEQALQTAVGKGHYVCDTCHLTYRKTVKKCSNCGGELRLS